jgi:hypothetical protein
VNPAELSSLRALRDCGVIRASRAHPGYSALLAARLVIATPCGDAADYRLNARGLAAVKEKLK